MCKLGVKTRGNWFHNDSILSLVLSRKYRRMFSKPVGKLCTSVRGERHGFLNGVDVLINDGVVMCRIFAR